MALALCASCKSKVEEGAVRCVSCNADLFHPGIFQQVLGWVVVSLSSIPFAISEVTTAEKDWTPLFLGGAVVVLGAVLIFAGRARGKGAQPRVIIESASPASPNQASQYTNRP